MNFQFFCCDIDLLDQGHQDLISSLLGPNNIAMKIW